MDLRVLVLTADSGLADLLRAQVENLGCPCTVVEAYDDAGPAVSWADAAIVDLADDGFDDLSRLRVEASRVRVLAIAPDGPTADDARAAGAEEVLVEPLAIADLVDALRRLGTRPHDDVVVDLRPGQSVLGDTGDAPWWASR